ncbi:MAG: acyltransferase domain-containing protein [Minicystis sp.]
MQGYVAATLLRSAGLAADIVAGHSFGEIAALTAAGAWSFATGAEIVCRRVLALRGAPPGRMLAVHLDADHLRDEIRGLRRDDVHVAVLNAADQSVAAGTAEGIAALEERLARSGTRATMLASRYAFHSPLLAPAVGSFASALANAITGAPSPATYSPIDRVYYGAGPLGPARLLPMHLVTPLDFGAAVRALYEEGCRTFVECGGGSTLAALVRRNLPREPGLRVISTFRAGEDVVAELRRAAEALRDAGCAPEKVAALASEGVEVSSAGARAADGRDVTAVDAPRTEGAATEAVAIVGMGAVLPGAGGVEAYLAQMLAGTSGIVDRGERSPELAIDFLNPDRVADKTYSLLIGAVDTLGPFAERTGYEPQTFERLPKTARMLACALAEARSNAAALREGAPRRIACILGSTADGSNRARRRDAAARRGAGARRCRRGCAGGGDRGARGRARARRRAACSVPRACRAARACGARRRARGRAHGDRRCGVRIVDARGAPRGGAPASRARRRRDRGGRLSARPVECVPVLAVWRAVGDG